MDDVLILATSTANVASVAAWLTRAGCTARLTTDRGDIERAAALVIPGVGSFGAAMDALNALDLVHVLRERVSAQRPTLGICLGMQLLFESSEESPGVDGLGVVHGGLRRFRASERVPHMGWNSVASDPGGRIVRDGMAYFANSFAMFDPPDGWSSSYTTHGTRFVSAIQRGPVVGCQFHPELSGRYGAELLENWVASVSEITTC